MRRILLVCAFLVASSSSVYSAGFALYEASVRVSGMMGAFVADGSDVSTIFFNPAGIAQLSGFHFQTGGVMISPSTTFRGPLPYSLAESELASDPVLVPNMYASYQVLEGLSVGLGVYVPFGLGTEWDPNWVGAAFNIETRLQGVIVNPVAAYKLPFDGIGDLYIGGGLQIGVIGNAVLDRKIADFAGRDGRIRLEGETDGSYYGYNLGFIYRPIEKFSIGVSYKSELELDLNGDAEFTNLPESGFPPGNTGSLQITTPAQLAVGISTKPITNLTLNLDYLWWGWSSYDQLAIDFDVETAALSDLALNRDYNDSFQVRFGAEYVVEKVEGLTIRGGIGFDQSPAPDATLDPTLPDSDRIAMSTGLTYMITPNVGFNMYYTFFRFVERKIDHPDNPFHGIYNTKANILGTSISLKF